MHLLVLASCTACALLAGTRADAQIGLTNDMDATALPRGGWSLRVSNEWTRFDEVFGAPGAIGSGTSALGALLASDSLGARQFPALAGLEASLRALTGDVNSRLSLGVMRSVADSRVVTTPIGLHYGLTSRLSIGVMMPVVQTRTTMTLELNPTGRAGNVGVLPSADPAAVQVQQAFTAASVTLEQQLATCGTPTPSSVCSRQAEARSLLDATRAFAGGVAQLYGTGGGQAFAPFAADPIFPQVAAHQQALSDQFASFFGTGITAPALPGAANTAGLDELRRFLREQQFGTRRDTLNTIERFGVGDLELSLRWQVADAFADTTRRDGGPGYRVAVEGAVRLPTGLPVLTGMPYEIPTGGRFDVEGRVAADVRPARYLAATLSAQYALPISGRNVPFVPNPLVPVLGAGVPLSGEWKPGSVLRLSASPHVLVTRFFSLDAHYAFVRFGGDQYTFLRDSTDLAVVPAPDFGAGYTSPATMEHRVGFGFSYSSTGQYARFRVPLPIEIAYTHLETIAASGGIVPKGFRDVLRVRIFTPR